MRTLIIASLLALACTSAEAAQACRDAKGKFIKCPVPAAVKCRDVKTKKFATCGKPGTEPVTVNRGSQGVF